MLRHTVGEWSTRTGLLGDFSCCVIHISLGLVVWLETTQNQPTSMEVATETFVNTIFPTRKAVKDSFAPLAKLLHSDKGGKDDLFAQAIAVKSRAMLHFQISTDPYIHSHDAFRAGLFEELCKKNPGAQGQHVAMWEFEQRQAVGIRYPATMLVGTLDTHPLLHPSGDVRPPGSRLYLFARLSGSFYTGMV